jgi:hypothetical protein
MLLPLVISAVFLWLLYHAANRKSSRVKIVPDTWLPEKTQAAGEWFESPYAVRLDQKHPTGMAWELAHNVKVVGISRPDAAHNAASMMSSVNPRIVLVRERDNPKDSNAIEVIGIWDASSGGEQRGHIGYLPREFAKTISKNVPIEPLAATIWVMFKAHDDHSAGLRISVWADGRNGRKSKAKLA